MDDRVYKDWRQEWIDHLESRILELDNENIRLRKAFEQKQLKPAVGLRAIIGNTRMG